MRVLRLVRAVKLFFQRTEARVHLGRGDLGVRGLGKAKLADRESGIGISVVVADGRPKGPAQDRSMRVEIAGLGYGIEDRTRIGVERLFEELNLLLGVFVLRENAGRWIAGKEGIEMFTGVGDAT